jgi:hypothetical protein
MIEQEWLGFGRNFHSRLTTLQEISRQKGVFIFNKCSLFYSILLNQLTIDTTKDGRLREQQET